MTAGVSQTEMLAALVAVFTAIHLITRVETSKGSICVEQGENVISVELSKLSTVPVKGEIKNAKGDVKTIDGQGIRLEDVLSSAGVDTFQVITIFADDKYSAQVIAEEVRSAEKVYLLIENETARLVVFGDANSKRNVSNVVRLVVG